MEKIKLLKLPRKDYSIRSRLAYIKTILNNPIAALEDNETIGIGSKFSIMFFGDEKVETKRLEMINMAFSSETDGEYVERISPLGSKLFGLGENEEFYVRIGNNKSISGIVFDIDNKQDAYTTNSAVNYQFYKNNKSRRG